MDTHMTVAEALSRIHAPKGMTSLIAGVMSNDFDPIRDQNAAGKSLSAAQAQLEAAEKAQAECQSDWAYWGYMGDISYWRAVVSILKAAEITGPDKLPNVPAPDLSACVVMDACSKVERFGSDILAAAKPTA